MTNKWRNSICTKHEEKIVKTFPYPIDVEIHKSKAMHGLSKKAGFVFPKILSYDLENKEITYQYIEDLHSIRTLYLSFLKNQVTPFNAITAFEKSGEMLGKIHKNLKLNQKSSWQPPASVDKIFRKEFKGDYKEILQNTPQAFLHTDFGFSNLFFTSTEDLVLLDPSPNSYITFKADTFGSIYLDLGLILMCMDGLVPIAEILNIRRNRAKILSQALIKGYTRQNPIKIDYELLKKIKHAIARSYLKKRYPPGIAQLAFYYMYNLESR